MPSLLPAHFPDPAACRTRLRAAALAAHLACGAALFAAAPPAAVAQAAAPARAYDVPAGPLADALNRFAQQAGVSIVVDAARVQGLRAPALKGRYGVEEGFGRLLHGSGFVLGTSSAGYVLLPAPSVAAPAAAPAAGPAASTLPPVHVTATAERAGPPRAYAGGQVARGARVGVLGEGDYMDVPVSIVAFTSEFRDDTQALSVSDMLKYSVSAQTPQAGAVPTTDVIYVRGFNIGSYDGTFLGLPGLLGRMPPVEAVERVELLLGASAFANGQPASVGGTINIVPKRAGAEPLVRVGVSYRSESILGTSIDAGRRFGEGGAFGLRVNAAYADGDTELEDGRRRAFSRAIALDWQGARVRASLDYMGNDRRLPAEAWFVVNPGVRVPDARRASRDFRQPWTVYEDTWETVVARGEWDVAEQWTLSGAWGRMWTKVERFSQVSEITDDAGSMVDAWGGTLAHSKQRRIVHAGELMLRGEFATGPLTHRARIGYSRVGSNSAYAAVGSTAYPFASNIYAPVDYPRPALGTPVLPDDAPEWRNTGVFASDEIGLMDDRLRVLLGARQVRYWTPAEDDKKKWSPAFGVLFKLRPTLTVYANRLESLEPGFRVEAPAANAGTVLPPLPADQTEIGLKADFGRLGFTAALFQIDKPSYFLDTGTGIVGANGRQVNRGLELSVFGEATPRLRLYGSMTFIDPKLRKTEAGLYDGKTATSAARFMANLRADWDVPGVPGLALLGGVSHSGRIHNDDDNTQTLPAWTRLDAGLRYRSALLGKPAVWRLTVDNLLDRKYFVSERGTIYLAPARTMGASVTLDL